MLCGSCALNPPPLARYCTSCGAVLRTPSPPADAALEHWSATSRFHDPGILGLFGEEDDWFVEVTSEAAQRWFGGEERLSEAKFLTLMRQMGWLHVRSTQTRDDERVLHFTRPLPGRTG